ncbi:conserved hypothetical protein, partial [Culex quinquefasciatus]
MDFKFAENKKGSCRQCDSSDDVEEFMSFVPPVWINRTAHWTHNPEVAGSNPAAGALKFFVTFYGEDDVNEQTQNVAVNPSR